VVGMAQLSAGRTQEAISSLQRSVELAPWYSVSAGSLAAAYYCAGDQENSKVWSRRLAEEQNHTVGAAIYYAAAGEVDAMFAALDGAYEQRDVFLIYVQSLPSFDPYRSDPRFQALLKRMNFE
jgi:hypothetical protein